MNHKHNTFHPLKGGYEYKQQRGWGISAMEVLLQSSVMPLQNPARTAVKAGRKWDRAALELRAHKDHRGSIYVCVCAAISAPKGFIFCILEPCCLKTHRDSCYCTLREQSIWIYFLLRCITIPAWCLKTAPDASLSRQIS